ncbi:hypothetical protein VV869_18930 [Photobacterium sp. MCCC 1A19761]|uniref:hypothetical protein n=1 Tax=Photobacterium sp. MCCC 1A19761 TaxID=3115000 RepID=UPI00307E4E6E
MSQETQAILSFLKQIGLPYELAPLQGKTFLPGVKLVASRLVIDEEQLLYSGDILHEAGHYAVCDPHERHLLDGDIYKNGLTHGRKKDRMHGEEMAAIAWSVAAIQHIGLPLEVVLHADGYRGASQSLIKAFREGGGFGYPLLNAWDMTCPEQGFPVMQRWIRELSWTAPES